MEEKRSSSWDDLIKQIGAAPAPDALERKRPAIETKFDPPPSPPPIAKPKPGDWNSLADTLGIEAVEPPPRPVAPPTTSDLEASFASIVPMESAFEEIIEEEIDDIEFIAEDPDFDTDEQAEASARADDEADALSGEAARNAFEALFQAGSFGALPPREKPIRKPEGPRGPQWREIPEGRRQESRDQVARNDDDDAPRRPPLSEGAAEGEDPNRSEDRGPGRPRRRRHRRGRGKESAARPLPADENRPLRDEDERDETDPWSDSPPIGEAGDERDDDDQDAGPESESGDKPVRRRRVRRRRRRPASDEPAVERPAVADRNGRSAAPRDQAPDDDEDDEDDDDEDALLGPVAGDDDADDDGEDSSSRRASHKNIPTWADAIGVMVETNMQSRKNSPPPRPAMGRDRDRGRGRGRGGRGRRGGKP